MKTRMVFRLVLGLMAACLLVFVACKSGGGKAPGYDPSPQSSTTASGSVTINLVAKNIAFDKKDMKVPAGATVTINFDNQDSGVPHNFALYTNSDAKTKIYQGEMIVGPKTTTYTFTAPSEPGKYFFRCDAHPTTMTGTFTVG